MSIKAMTWAFSLPLEPRAKLALLAIADNARDDGIAWPSRETIAEKSSQSRSTVGRRIKSLVGLGIIAIKERFREDGTQTTDEIHLDLSLSPDDVMRKMHDSGETNGSENDADDGTPAGEGAGRDVDDAVASRRGGGCQPDTLGSQSGHPGVSLVTGGGLQSGHPQDEPSLEPDSPPAPSGGPLSKADREAKEKRDALWVRFVGSYPGIGAMDQTVARAEFDQMPVDDCEWAVSVLPQLKEDLRKARDRPPKNAHLWLRKAMFRNYPRAKIEPPPPDEVWIAEGSDEDRALRFVRGLAKAISPMVRPREGFPPGYPSKTAVGPDLLAMLSVIHTSPLRWPSYPRGSPEFAAWQTRFGTWTGRGLPVDPGDDSIRVPWQWPPKKDGTIYSDDDNEGETGT